MLRIFIGVKVHLSVDLLTLFHRLKQRCDDIKISWTRIDNFHFTIRFIGEVPEDYINSISLLLEKIAKNHPSFITEFTHVGFFESNSRPRVLFGEIQPVDALLTIKKQIDLALTELGVEIEKRDYRPHVTFGRIKNCSRHTLDATLGDVHQINLAKEPVVVKSIQLFESQLTNVGPIYKILRNFELL